MSCDAQSARSCCRPRTSAISSESTSLRAIRSGWVAPAGPELAAFEQEVAERVGVASTPSGSSSGTAALHLALVSWGVGPGDVVPVSTLTFAATVNAIRYAGAEPHFIDCDPATGNMSPFCWTRPSTDSWRRGRGPGDPSRSICWGNVPTTKPSPTSRIEMLAVLCDAAESFGRHAARPARRVVRRCVGPVIQRQQDHDHVGRWDAAHRRCRPGRARAQALHPGPRAGAHYEHTEVGYNYRLSNVLAALGRAQLSGWTR